MHKITLKTTLSTGLHPKAQKAVAKTQLNRFLDEMPEGTIAYVAGGAPRDWHHGWGCRDLDIFFYVPEEHAEAASVVLNNTYAMMKKGYGYYGVDGNEEIMSVHEYDIEKYSKGHSMAHRICQLVRVNKNPLEVINDFPISLSRIWMNKEGEIYCDDYYRMSYNSRVIHEIHQRQGWNYVYLDKILGRFSQYSFMPMNWEGRRPEEDQLWESA